MVRYLERRIIKTVILVKKICKFWERAFLWNCDTFRAKSISFFKIKCLRDIDSWMLSSDKGKVMAVWKEADKWQIALHVWKGNPWQPGKRWSSITLMPKKRLAATSWITCNTAKLSFTLRLLVNDEQFVNFCDLD